MNSTTHRVFSGTRATGRLHLGNYYGAIKGYIDLQNRTDLDCLYMVVDLHTITTPFDSETLAGLTRNVVLDYLAAGLDPEKSTITLQSLVPQHTYLSWLFSSAVSNLRLNHLPTFKEKVQMHPENVTLALFSYPVLMAADILLYKADLVPVGIDQEPHIEIAREIARKMNTRFGTTFPEPQRFATPIHSVPSLTGEGKMSKSVSDHSIFLTDEYEDIYKKISHIPTGSGKGTLRKKSKQVGGKRVSVQEYVDESGEVSAGLFSLFTFVEMFQGQSRRHEYEENFVKSGLRFGDIKKELSRAIAEDLKPIQERRQDLSLIEDYVEEVVLHGAKQAQEKAKAVIEETKEKMGFFLPKF